MTSGTRIPVFISCRDRLTCLQQLVRWLEDAGHERIYFVDNDSAYEPLLDYYRDTPHTVIALGTNTGHLAPWTSGVVAEHARNEDYIVTDPDVVPDEGCPLDAAEHLAALLRRYPTCPKAALGLRIDDLPEHFALRADVIAWESYFWTRKLRRGVYYAPTDTTFAVYRAGVELQMAGLRTGAPYVARHLPWYADSAAPDEEERFYRARARSDITNWHGEEFQVPTRPAPRGQLWWRVWRWRNVQRFGRPLDHTWTPEPADAEVG